MKKSVNQVVSILCAVVLLLCAGVGIAEHEPWDCPNCGRTGNTGNFCGGCGGPAPWIDGESASAASGQQGEGYGMALKNDVPMRNSPDESGEVIALLPYGSVTTVYGKYTDEGWHLVKYNGVLGFISRDQLRIMSSSEAAAYRESLTGGTPASSSPKPSNEPTAVPELSGSAQELGLEYKAKKDGTAEITKYTGSAQKIVIPHWLDGYRVVSIGNFSFYSCKNLTSVTIPDSVISIGHSAFSFCTSLSSIRIPDSVKFIGNSAFSTCTSLRSISIPNSVLSIGQSAFYCCTNLNAVALSNSVTFIGSSAFYSCTSLSSITLPESVTTIESYVFNNCPKLTVRVTKGSLAERYCKEYEIKYQYQ